MKNSKTCIKCNSSKVIKVPEREGSKYHNSIYIGLTIFSAISIYRYVCCECGYVGEWIDDKAALDKLYGKFSEGF